MTPLEFVSEHFFKIAFYAALALLIFFNRKKIHFVGIVAMYRSKLGISAMEIGKKYGAFFRSIGYIGAVVGFLVMGLMVGVLIFSLYQLLFIPNTPPPLQPVIPGIQVPGTTFTPPFWTTIIGLFVVVVVHEFAHGVLARAHNIPVKNTGLFQLLIFPGAFVEPDEKKMNKASKGAQISIYAVGAFTNFLTAILTVFLIMGLGQVGNAIFEPQGFTFTTVANNSPAMAIGLPTNTVFNEINGKPVNSQTELATFLLTVKPGESIVMASETNTYSLKTISHPDNESRSYIGIMNIQNHLVPKFSVPPFTLPILLFVSELLLMILILNIGVGTFNLIPMGPIDGGKMYLIGMTKLFGEKNGKKIWANTSLALFALILFLLSPIIIAVGKAIIGLA